MGTVACPGEGEGKLGPSASQSPGLLFGGDLKLHYFDELSFASVG